MLCVTLVGHFVICLRPKVLQNSRYFSASDDIFWRLLLCSYFPVVILNYSVIISYLDPLVYAILCLTY